MFSKTINWLPKLGMRRLKLVLQTSMRETKQGMEVCLLVLNTFVLKFFHNKDFFLFIYLNSYPRVCLLILEREEDRQRQKEEERDISVREKHGSHMCPSSGSTRT